MPEFSTRGRRRSCAGQFVDEGASACVRGCRPPFCGGRAKCESRLRRAKIVAAGIANSAIVPSAAPVRRNAREMPFDGSRAKKVSQNGWQFCFFAKRGAPRPFSTPLKEIDQRDRNKIEGNSKSRRRKCLMENGNAATRRIPPSGSGMPGIVRAASDGGSAESPRWRRKRSAERKSRCESDLDQKFHF